MIKYENFRLDNGLEVLVHEDTNSEIAVVNILYKVGSRDESEDKTGFAHLFEHLMFGGSQNISDFDGELQKVGGESNAFTSTDITNYYITLPAANIETAFWLESDRMHYLNLSDKIIEVQRKVVIEEFKQRYLNQPYGTAMHLIRDLSFERHPYKWPPIGKTIQDVENITREDIESFYFNHYHPGNAVLSVAGNVTAQQVVKLAKKWFSDIPPGEPTIQHIPAEDKQRAKKTLTVTEDIPTNALYKAYHVPGRLQSGYLECDLISDIFGFGRSSLLEQRLVKNSPLFANCNAYVLGNVDPGLMMFTGKMEKGESVEEAEYALDRLISEFKESMVSNKVLEKTKNQVEAMRSYDSIQLLNRAMNLAYYTHLGRPEFFQKEYEDKMAVTADQLHRVANEVLVEENASVVYFKTQRPV